MPPLTPPTTCSLRRYCIVIEPSRVEYSKAGIMEFKKKGIREATDENRCPKAREPGLHVVEAWHGLPSNSAAAHIYLTEILVWHWSMQLCFPNQQPQAQAGNDIRFEIKSGSSSGSYASNSSSNACIRVSVVWCNKSKYIRYIWNVVNTQTPSPFRCWTENVSQSNKARLSSVTESGKTRLADLCHTTSNNWWLLPVLSFSTFRFERTEDKK